MNTIKISPKLQRKINKYLRLHGEIESELKPIAERLAKETGRDLLLWTLDPWNRYLHIEMSRKGCLNTELNIDMNDWEY